MSSSSVGLSASNHRVRQRIHMHQQPSVTAESQAPPSTRASSSTRPPPRPRQQGFCTCYICRLQAILSRRLARGRRCTFCNSKGHIACVCRKKAADFNELNVDLAGIDNRNPETGVAEYPWYSLHLNNDAAYRVRGVGGKPAVCTQKLNIRLALGKLLHVQRQ